ncbi:MAG: FAD-dependent oxidoreductase, partial [Chitinophagaceae bacterium]
MTKKTYDVITIGAGSGGLSVGLAMNKFGFKVLMIARYDKDIGGDCLNDGCVPSKALIHVSKIAHSASMAKEFGLNVSGTVDIKKVLGYVYQRQEIIRVHENAKWLMDQGVDVELGEAKFYGMNEVEVNGQVFKGKKIIIATGSTPRKLKIKGVENVKYYDNENIFHADELPKRLLVIGGGPISIEISQALKRLGSDVTLVQLADTILEHDDKAVTEILLKQLQQEGIKFFFNADIDSFISANEAIIKLKDGRTENIRFDAVFVGIG